MKLTRRQKGFSIMELMVSVTIGLIIITAVIWIYVSTVSSNTKTLKNSKLNMELNTLMSVMTNDIRRAGIWGAGIDYRAPHNNPFANPNDTALRVVDYPNSDSEITAATMIANPATTGSCILYSYDSDFTDGNGVVRTKDIMGFRLKESNGIRVVEMRQRADNDTAASRSTCADTDNSWETVTDNKTIDIDTLTFSLANSTCINTREPNEADDDGDPSTTDTDEMDCYSIAPASGDFTAQTRQVDIVLAGSLISDSNTRIELKQSVRVRNDLVLLTP